jgi:serine/threonine protein phosphatase PrpC
MTPFCSNCNHEFAPEDQNCANCGRPRPPVIQKKYAQILNQADPADENDSEITQPYTVLPAGLRSEAPAAAPVKSEAAPVPAVASNQAPVSAPARADAGFSWSLPTQSELEGTGNAALAEEANPAEKDEPELPSFWTCSQCISLNPSSADYCENCGAIRPTATPENRVAAKDPNAPANPLPVPAHSSASPEVTNPVQQGPETTKLTPEMVAAFAAEHQQAKSRVKLVSSSLSDVGVSRKGATNEDSFFQVELNRCFESKPESFGFYMVADGMGGQAAGEVASRTAIQTVGPKIMAELAGPWLTGQNLEAAHVAGVLEEVIGAAHTRLFEYNREEQIDSGTTITACCVIGNQAVFANVGDSRTYLFRPARPPKGKGDTTDPVLPVISKDMLETKNLETPPGDRATRKLNDQTDKLKPEVLEKPESPRLVVERVTRDQSLVQHLVEQGELDIDDVYEDPRRNVILFALGAPDETVPVDTYQRTLESGDMILLCSDGLWEMVRDPAIAEILLAQPDLTQATQSLVNQANENGGADNVTVILVKAN